MYIISLMSGTSLDGLDIAYCEILDEGRSFRLLAAETIPYPAEWVERLSHLEKASAYEYALVDVELGRYFGRCVNRFRERHPGQVDLVSSHGHTIFHQPHLGLTTQIASGADIAAVTGVPTAYDFRSLDVALGGQGAPLVPIGDEYLFGQYSACLNLGGFSNISYNQTASPEGRIAFDISPCNMALNRQASRLGMPYDRDGLSASCGTIVPELLQRLNSLGHYALKPPKSLGKEWYVSQMEPLLDEVSPSDCLATLTEHIAQQVAASLPKTSVRKPTLLVTGGGARNAYLVYRIRLHTPRWKVVVPASDIIDYKEAIVFALLGYLCSTHKCNCLSSVTGASHSCVGGVICDPR